MIFQDISKFTNTSDYLSILNAALITDLIVMLRVVLGQIKAVSLKSWYNKYGICGVGADVLSLVIGVLIARFIYPYLFSTWSVFLFAGLAVLVQLTHDLLFAQLFNAIPRGQSQILDTFKDYAKELGAVILLADAAMIVSTVFIGSFLAGLSMNTNIVILIFFLYLVPYILYSIKN
jgi:hypothetical protein